MRRGLQKSGRFVEHIAESACDWRSSFLPCNPMHVYEIRCRKHKRGVDLISDVPPFGRLWYGEPNAIGNAIGYAKHRSRSHDAVIRVYDEAGNMIETHKHAGDFKEWVFNLAKAKS